MQFNHRRVMDDVCIGEIGVAIPLRFADVDTCGCCPVPLYGLWRKTGPVTSF